MTTAVVLRKLAAFVAGAAAVACMTASPGGRKVVENVPDGASGGRAELPDGSYACSIEESGYKYPPFACVVSTSGGRTRLEKLGGSQRIRGDVTFTGAGGFRFEGEFYCPWGDCTQAIAGDFHGTNGQDFVGEFLTSTGTVIFALRYLPGGGADSYGGGAYGGGVYGGGAYGGGVYGRGGYSHGP